MEIKFNSKATHAKENRPGKSFSGSKSSGSTDSGTSAHVFGSFLNWPIHQVIDHTRHWSASNQRQGLWDGLLKIELNTIEDDAEAFAYLESVKKP